MTLGYFYGHIYDTYTEMCLSRYWCHNGERHQECENMHVNYNLSTTIICFYFHILIFHTIF